jgi:catechol 2,3-dioxygenase-like lactoylglutathione lyase family enzyme
MPPMEWKLELVPIPVSDVDAAKQFYMEKMGFTLDHDVSPGPHFRVVQLTPPGSACSICFGLGIVKTPPGSVQGLHLVVSDIHAARAQLLERGVEVGDVQELGKGIFFAFLKDPDGNSWAVQHVAPEARNPKGGQS